MAVNVEMWKPDIIEELYKDNEFLRYAYNADSYVIGGSVVHIPNSGGASGAQRNRATLPATIVTRSDVDVVYPLDEYTSDPTRIDNADTVELSYDKRSSIIRENTAYLKEFAADSLLYSWAKDLGASQKILTTGADALASAEGATGNRKMLTEADVRKAKIMLDKQNVPKAGRYMILESNMMDHLMSDDSLKYAFQKVVDLPEGVVTKLYGFHLLERSSVIRQSTGGTTGTPKLPETASAVTDDAAAIFYQRDAVERALGTVTMFDNPGRAEYYGDIMSFLVRMGGRIRRNDKNGVGLIVAAA